MNKFKADFATDRLLLDIPEPILKMEFGDNSSAIVTYQSEMKLWSSRLSYSLSPELKSMLTNGQVIGEDEFTFSGGDQVYSGLSGFSGKYYNETPLIAIPLPDSKNSFGKAIDEVPQELRDALKDYKKVSEQTNKVKGPEGFTLEYFKELACDFLWENQYGERIEKYQSVRQRFDEWLSQNAYHKLKIHGQSTK